ncbi:Alw26I/Eco31I/Esp3I family type II restriction adenine-specific DNA-methyltransferase [Arcicella sp. LKC2W]|uniref:Alw26I/Eco31I/Esp3I family type II restriction adenine-specific DNA-methyltransferase n=1 Tax=Arcicella sp. LKC2W TaxID=2984198 RepID=UPI002B20C17B|nr:Alw26I/Eco31I/Esp3I family type II restriction adenine-specific DNA-methyltransferase [Arcicella sp. LKC2W]MEA5461680.1 Alw26I/Eco31I/Esp3I family type II restriction adenine-specific DNA-methyltransferase [Arcicella sp. LKC2W]
MNHIKNINSLGSQVSESLIDKLTGRYFTHEVLAKNAIQDLLIHSRNSVFSNSLVKIADPFAGDGRMIYWLIEEWGKLKLPVVHWEVYLWDINEIGLKVAEIKMEKLIEKGFKINYFIENEDAFKLTSNYNDTFDIVITNPPWELLKPDSKELSCLSENEKALYIKELKYYDDFLAKEFVLSQPTNKFAGWGTNLSRVGLEVSSLVAKPDGLVLIVLPASFFADDQSRNLREFIFSKSTVLDISYYPAEAKLFGNADISSSTMVFRKREKSAISINISLYNKFLSLENNDVLNLKHSTLRMTGYTIPISTGSQGILILDKINAKFKRWKSVEINESNCLWAGREIDETGIQKWLFEGIDGIKFLKGRMVNRYEIKTKPFQIVVKEGWKIPQSVYFEKIVWRDVSRPSQKRRLIATLVNEQIVAGNSLGVCYYKDGDGNALRILLGIMNSLCFEFQLKSYLATSHISLSAIRKVCIPDRNDFINYQNLLPLVEESLSGATSSVVKIEAYVAKIIYNLNEEEFNFILNSFEKLTIEEKNCLKYEFKNLSQKND